MHIVDHLQYMRCDDLISFVGNIFSYVVSDFNPRKVKVFLQT
jgi:hypothetical protein